MQRVNETEVIRATLLEGIHFVRTCEVRTGVRVVLLLGGDAIKEIACKV